MADTIKITTLAQLKVALQAAKTYIDGQIGGLGTMAGKSEVAYDDLAAALKTLIDGKAAQATVDTLVGEDTGEAYKELYLYLLAGVWTVIFMRANITLPPVTQFKYCRQPTNY